MRRARLRLPLGQLVGLPGLRAQANGPEQGQAAAMKIERLIKWGIFFSCVAAFFSVVALVAMLFGH
jgi:hypothetical protein